MKLDDAVRKVCPQSRCTPATVEHGEQFSHIYNERRCIGMDCLAWQRTTDTGTENAEEIGYCIIYPTEPLIQAAEPKQPDEHIELGG